MVNYRVALLVAIVVLGLGLFGAAVAQQVTMPQSNPIDWTQIILALIAALVGSIPAAIAAYRRIGVVDQKVTAVATQVDKVEIQTNSMSEKLAVAADKLAVAERERGHLEGRDEAHTEARADAAVRAAGAAEERNRRASEHDLEAHTPAITPAPTSGSASVVVEGVKLQGEVVDPKKPQSGGGS